ncbi:MAG: hypothetical protein APR54_05890 [Candidatus Cloacimonas sp. SDB]|nr:MAG: hypothetical protein APR54_05890 [Candidatus Cloacimonas sp. SDB]
MTGYGKTIVSNDRYEIEMEIRSVNNRYLDLKLSTPRELNKFENEIRVILSDKIKRGKVDLKVRLRDYLPPQLELDKDKLKAYWQLYQEAAELISSQEPVSLIQLLNEKSIINIKESDNEDLKEFVLNNLQIVIAKHQEIALKEGESMLSFLSDSMDKCIKSLHSIKKIVPKYKEMVYNKIKKNIELLLESELDDNAMKRLMLEVSLYVEKSDINEEIVRLEDHFNKFCILLKSKDIAVGKSLNFILQEMNREINTVGSKFNYLESYDHILSIKEEIEKCREIVQNVE